MFSKVVSLMKRCLCHRLITALLVVSFVHMIVQIGLQADDFVLHAQGSSRISQLAAYMDPTDPNNGRDAGTTGTSGFPSRTANTDTISPTASSIDSTLNGSDAESSGDEEATNTGVAREQKLGAGNGDYYPARDHDSENDGSDDGEDDDEDGNDGDYGGYHDDDHGNGSEEGDQFYDYVEGRDVRNLISENTVSGFHVKHKRISYPSSDPLPGGFYADLYGLSTAQLAMSTRQCFEGVNWFQVKLDRHTTQDIALILFQIWIFSLVILSIVYESLPHLFAVVISKVVALIFSVQSVVQLRDLRKSYHNLVNDESCRVFGFDRLGDFWKSKFDMDIAVCVLEGVVLVTLCSLLWKLKKIFSWLTFRSVGASRKATRVHYVLLISRTLLQLGAYFITAFLVILLHELIGRSSNVNDTHIPRDATFHQTGFYVVLGVGCGITPVWLFLGWKSISTHWRSGLVLFAVIGAMFISLGGFIVSRKEFRKLASYFPFLCFVGIMAGIVCLCLLITAAYYLLFIRIEEDKIASSKDDSWPRNEKTEPITIPDPVVRPALFSKDFSDHSSMTDGTSYLSRTSSWRTFREPSPVTGDNVSSQSYPASFTTGDDRNGLSVGEPSTTVMERRSDSQANPDVRASGWTDNSAPSQWLSIHGEPPEYLGTPRPTFNRSKWSSTTASDTAITGGTDTPSSNSTSRRTSPQSSAARETADT